MTANEQAKIAARGLNAGLTLCDQDIEVLLENIEAQIIDAIACDRSERSKELEMELELAKIDLRREREENKVEADRTATVMIELQGRNSALKSALTAVNDLLALYLYPSRGVKDG